MLRRRLLVFCVVALSLESCSYIPQDPSFATISGIISYREKTPLVPEAVVIVQLLDMSAGGAQSNIIAEQRLERPGQIPIRFDLKYDQGSVVRGHRYGLTARIYAGRRLLFDTQGPYPVLGEDRPARLELVLERVPAPANDFPLE